MRVRESLLRAVRWGLAALVATGLAASAATAQDPDLPAPLTLHVYTDLLQIPVLVLDEAGRPVLGLKPKQFRLSVDSGPLFQLSYVRREGDDPLALTILLDTSGSGAAMEARLPSAVGTLAERSLSPRDRVTTEAVNGCSLSQTGPFAVTTATALEAEVATVFRAQSTAVTGAQSTAASGVQCEARPRLREVIARACVELEKGEGRRVLLLVTDGVDRGSTISWRELREMATTRSVAIFVVSVPPVLPRSWTAGTPAGWTPAEPNALAALCDLTGGTLVRSDAAGVKGAVNDIVRMLRERYILEFERPALLDIGAHDLAVKVSRAHVTVRGAGISFPRVRAEERDPAAPASSDNARSSQPGTRRILDAQPPP